MFDFRASCPICGDAYYVTTAATCPQNTCCKPQCRKAYEAEQNQKKLVNRDEWGKLKGMGMKDKQITLESPEVVYSLLDQISHLVVELLKIGKRLDKLEAWKEAQKLPPPTSWDL